MLLYDDNLINDQMLLYDNNLIYDQILVYDDNLIYDKIFLYASNLLYDKLSYMTKIVLYDNRRTKSLFSFEYNVSQTKLVIFGVFNMFFSFLYAHMYVRTY